MKRDYIKDRECPLLKVQRLVREQGTRMTMEEIREKLEKTLTPKRFAHSVNVMHTAAELARQHGEDTGNAALAGLLHDCARDIRGGRIFELCRKYGICIDEISRLQPELLHGQLGAKLAREEYGVECIEVLEAVKSHIAGRPGMDLLGRIIFVADYIEPARDFPGIDAIREASREDINRAMVLGIDSTIKYVLDRGWLLHPDAIATRNWALLQLKEGDMNL